MEFLQSFLRNASPGAKQAVYLSAAAALGVVAYYSFFRQSGSSSSSLAPALTEEEARDILKQIVERAKLTVPRLLKFAEGIKQQIAMQGQEIDDKQLYKSVLLPHFETAIRDIQAATLEEKGVDDDEFEDAVNTYLAAGDKDIISLANTLKKLYVNFGGEVEEDEESTDGGDAVVAKKKKGGKAQEISFEDFVQMLHDLSSDMIEATDTYAGRYVAENGVPRDVPSLQTFQLGLMQVTEALEGEKFEKYGITAQDFQALVGQYQNQREVQEVFYVMKVMNVRILAKHGIPVPDEGMM